MLSTKEKIAELLREKRGQFVSGEEIAKALGVSRAAVCKNIASLKSGGFDIEAVTNKGYRFNGADDTITTDGIRAYLSTELLDKAVFEIVTETASTNNLLRKRAVDGVDEWYTVCAIRQTAGKGRMGRSFFSPQDTGVYVSILLKPQLKPENAVLITTAAAVAVCRALEKLGAKKPEIKWVNDVVVARKKVCGILTEASFNLESGKLDYAILGVGVNMYTPDGGFPEELRDIAGAVFSERGEDIRNKFIAFFLNEFYSFYKKLAENPHKDEYRKRCFVVGERVSVILGEDKRDALVLGVEDDCALSVKFDNGEIKKLNSGEISLKLK